MIRSRPTVLGVSLTPGTHNHIYTEIQLALQSESGLLHVVTTNPEYVMTARTNAAFRQSINAAGIATVDGAGLALAMKLLHPDTVSERYTGVTLTPDAMQLSAATGHSIFLLGAGPGVAEEAGRRLQAQHPAATIAGIWADGSPRAEDDSETIRRIAESGAGIVLVAYGAPAQICWIERNLPALQQTGVRMVAGVGGALDYISGNVPWAPPLVRKLGLEWLYRLAREPWRWRRQLVLPQFAALVFIEFIRTRLRVGVE